MENNYSFTPQSGDGSKQPKHENMLCFGTDLRFQENYLTEINLNWLIASYNECHEKDKFFNAFFDKLAGNDKLRKQIIAGETEKEIKETWESDLTNFKRIRKKYLIY